MKLSKSLRHAFNMVIHSKLRSWLTILGIVIGVASVIAIMAMGQGMQSSITDQLGGLGADLITITPGYTKSSAMMHGPGRNKDSASSSASDSVELTRTDLQALKSISDIKLIDTNIRSNVDIAFLGNEGSVSLTGVDESVWSRITTTEIREGRLLDSADQNVIVIGGKLADSYFEDVLGINKMLTIEGSAYRIVGILDDSTTNIYMPIQLAYQVLDKETDVYDSIIVKVKDVDIIDETIAKIEKKLMMVRHVTQKDRDFSVISSQQFQETRAEMLGTMTAFLTAIAAVSLLVGAVGIANTMFTSVLEKTKEIGIMKAIGAKNRDILLIFIFNAALIGMVGGIIGILLGTMLSNLLPTLLGGTPLGRGGSLVTADIVLLALFVSIGVGVLAGVVPAWQGSKLKPVDALRYE